MQVFGSVMGSRDNSGKIHLFPAGLMQFPKETPYVLRMSYNLVKQIGEGRGGHKGRDRRCPGPPQLQISQAPVSPLVPSYGLLCRKKPSI